MYGQDKTEGPDTREVKKTEDEDEGEEDRVRGADARGGTRWMDAIGPSRGTCVTDGVQNLADRLVRIGMRERCQR